MALIIKHITSSSFTLLFLLMLLWLTNTSAYHYTRDGCRASCGNVIIPFPFGIDVNCSLNEWYSIECRSSNRSSDSDYYMKDTPYLTNIRLEVLDISLRGGFVLVNHPVLSPNCSVINNGSSSVDLTGSPFKFSGYHNLFVAVGAGCDNQEAMMLTVLLDNKKNMPITNCTLTCNSSTNNISSCTSPLISEQSLQGYKVNLPSRGNNNQSGGGGGGGGVVQTSCTYGFLYNDLSSGFLYNDFTYSTINLNELSVGVQNKTITHVPVLLDWNFPAWNPTVPTPKSDNYRYCFPSSNAVSSSDGRCKIVESLTCYCKISYGGNPYLLDGCKDVRQPPKNFRQNFYLGKDLNKLLGLPLEKRKAPLLLNFVPTYTSKLADVPRQRKRKASPPTASIDQVASTSEPADQPSTSAPKKRSRRLVKAAKMKQPSKKVLNLLADLPDDMDDEPAQTTPQPKPKKVKKAQSKAKATEVDDAEDAVPISRLTKKTTSAPAKRPAEVQPTGATQQKKQKSAAGTSSGSRGPKIPWEPKVTIEDRPVYRNESAADVEIGVALSTAVLLDGDMEKNEKMNGYANYARMLQHSVQAIQHAHTFSMMAFETGKRLEETEKELADLQKSQKEDHLRMKELEDQAAEATKAKQIADEKAEATEALRTVAVAQQKEAEEKAAQAQKELQEGLATKEADLKASYDKGMDDVAEDYKLQVKQACNHGFILGYNALAKKLNLPADSPWRKTESLRLPCPLPPSPSQADVESESEAEAEDEDKDKDEALVRKAKSSSKDGQVLDLTGDEDLDAAPKKVDIGNLSSDLLLIGRSMEETLAEIDAEVEADKQAEVSENKEAEVVVDKEADAEVIPPKPSDVPAQSSANAEVV